MTNNQANQVLNDLDTITARLNTLITGLNNANTNLNTIESYIDQLDIDLMTFAGMVDSWFLMLYNYRYPIMAILMFIFTALVLKGVRDN